MTKVNAGLRIPATQPTDPEGLRAFVLEAEALGYHSIWVGHHVFYHQDVTDPLHTLTWVAALTNRVRLGTSVMLSAYLNPVLIAKAAATMDVLSGGRLTLGVSIGGTEAEYNSIGVPMNQRVGRLLENVAIMRKLWREEEGVNYEGRYYNIENGNIRPGPVQPGGVPIYFGGSSEPMLRRLARHADGWVNASQANPEQFLTRAGVVRELVRGFERDPDSFGLVKQHNVSIHPDPEVAMARAKEHWGRYYGSHWNPNASAIGTLEQVKENLKGFLASDIPEITLAIEPSNLDLDQLRAIWEATEPLRKS